MDQYGEMLRHMGETVARLDEGNRRLASIDARLDTLSEMIPEFMTLEKCEALHGRDLRDQSLVESMVSLARTQENVAVLVTQVVPQKSSFMPITLSEWLRLVLSTIAIVGILVGSFLAATEMYRFQKLQPSTGTQQSLTGLQEQIDSLAHKQAQGN